jgi:hypothetical protein
MRPGMIAQKQRGMEHEMTGAQHYAEAERLLALGTSDNVQRALVHAVLALAAVTAPDRVNPQTPESEFPFPFPSDDGSWESGPEGPWVRRPGE